MKETVDQYVKRLLSYSKGKNPAQVHRATPDRVSRLVKGLSKAQLMKRPGPGKWSLAEVLAHLAEGEMVVGYRMRTIVNANGTKIQAYDQDSWVKNSFFLKRHPEEALNLFKVLRKNNVAFAQSIPKKMRSYYGIHAERGKETVDRLLELAAGHDLNHLRTIEEAVKKIKKK